MRDILAGSLGPGDDHFRMTSLLLLPIAAMAIVSVVVALPLWVFLATLLASAGLSVWIRNRLPALPWPQSAAEHRLDLGALGIFVIAAFAPVFHLSIAPGADQAMYSAMARAILDGSTALSPATGEVTATLYPRGYPALLALLDLALLPPTASLIAAGLALLVFALALGTFLRALGLGPNSLAMAVVFTLVSRVPQVFFDFGGSSTTLALGMGLLAGSHLLAIARSPRGWTAHHLAVPVFTIAGLAVHPIGALAALGLAAVACVLLAPSGFFRAALLLLPGAAFAAALIYLGPEISGAERQWIFEWIRSGEAIFRGQPDSVAGAFVSMTNTFGIPFLVAAGLGGLAAAVDGRHRPLALLALVAVPGFVALEWLGPGLPVIGTFIYPSRFTPVLAVALVLPALAVLRTAPPRVRIGLLASGLLVGVGGNVRWFQGAVPMATPADLAAIACLDRTLPARAVIEGAYGDATQWIPALTGRAVLAPHVHISLRDEFTAMQARVLEGPRYLFLGERMRYGGPALEDTTGPALCRYGNARLYQRPATPTEAPPGD